MNWEIPHVQAVFRKGRWTGDQIANIHWIIEKAKEVQKYIYFCFIDYAKAFGCVDHNNLGKFLELGIPDHLTCHLRNLYAGHEATVRTGYGTTECFPGGSVSKKSVCDVGDPGLNPGLGRSPGEGNPFQYSCLETSMDREIWEATVHGIPTCVADMTEQPTHTHTRNNRLVQNWSRLYIVTLLI